MPDRTGRHQLKRTLPVIDPKPVGLGVVVAHIEIRCPVAIDISKHHRQAKAESRKKIAGAGAVTPGTTATGVVENPQSSQPEASGTSARPIPTAEAWQAS